MGLDMIVTSILLAIWFFLPIALIAYYLMNDKDSALYKRPHYRPFKGRSDGFLKRSLKKPDQEIYHPYEPIKNLNYSDRYKYFFSKSSLSDNNFYTADI